MKIRTKLIALTGLVLGMQPNGLVYADADDIFDFVPAIISGAIFTGRVRYVFECKKPTVEFISCGTGQQGFVENYYVIFYDKNRGLAPRNLQVQVFDTDTQKTVPLTAKYCKADAINYKMLGGYSDLPDDLKTPKWLPPAGKEAVYYRVTILNGSAGDHVAKITGWCVQID
jgi:hypothetical protein